MPAFDHKSELARVPHEPGVYRYFDATGEVIYVGKAKDLKNRVSSYFVKSNQHDRKTQRLVGQIRKIEFTIVHTEFDALLLENQLIKRYQPRYNILLRDDKTYPFILVTDEPFPRVVTTRRIERGPLRRHSSTRGRIARTCTTNRGGSLVSPSYRAQCSTSNAQ